MATTQTNTSKASTNGAVKAKRTPIDPNETPEARFKRVAGTRILKALDQIDLLSNCVGAQYAFTKEQIDKMEVDLTKMTQRTINILRTGKKPGIASKTYF